MRIGRLVTLTSSCINRLKTIAEQQPNIVLRVSLKGGGCAGVQYKFSLDVAPDENDVIVTSNGIELIIDCISFYYLKNSTIDYVSNIRGSNFVVYNPNVLATCNCGSSFGSFDHAE